MGSWAVLVLLSGTTSRAGSGTIFSAVLEMGSRAVVSVTEAKPRRATKAGLVKAVRVSVTVLHSSSSRSPLRGHIESLGYVPARDEARRAKARVEAIAMFVCGIRVCDGEVSLAL